MKEKKWEKKGQNNEILVTKELSTYQMQFKSELRYSNLKIVF